MIRIIISIRSSYFYDDGQIGLDASVNGMPNYFWVRISGSEAKVKLMHCGTIVDLGTTKKVRDKEGVVDFEMLLKSVVKTEQYKKCAEENKTFFESVKHCINGGVEK